jgi:hypothetical protein
MSIYQRFADKPWMRPTMYTSDADPSHYADEASAGVSRRSELVNGVPVVVDGRDHYQPTEFGDGRPDPSMADNSPMVYRGPDTSGVLDLPNHEEEVFPEEYKPAPRHAPAMASPAQPPPPRPEPTIQQRAQAIGVPTPAPSNPASGWPDLNVVLLGIIPQNNGQSVAKIGVGQSGFHATAESLEREAAKLTAWANALHAIGR